MPDYSKDIIDILSRVPQGLSIRKIVRHVYNAHNTLFETVPLDDVKRGVTQYLSYYSRSSSSPIIKTSHRGVYRLDPKAKPNKQLRLDFKDEKEDLEEKTNNADDDTSPDMFEGLY